MIDIGTCLRHYKREDIQNEMLRTAQGREIAVRYGDKGFGKRPDTLTYPKDILEFAKNGATSFHVSEERWSNVYSLDPGMRPAELDELRTGWDLVLDVDCPVFEYSKLIAHHLILALKKHGIKSVSCKFSGNKGFHIGVPFEAFPTKVGGDVDGEETRLWFPKKIKKILYYLASNIDSKENGYAFTKDLLKIDSIDIISEKTGIPKEELFVKVCNKCMHEFSESINRKKAKINENRIFQCPRCENGFSFEEDDYTSCKKCGFLLKKSEFGLGDRKNEANLNRCPKCNSTDLARKASPITLLNLDAVLISSRHMYRMVYSLHEKSGLSSVPVDPERVLEFEKTMADPKQLAIGKFKFLDGTDAQHSEARELFDNADSFHLADEEIALRTTQFTEIKKTEGKTKDFEEVQAAIPEEFFPPCIQNVLKGLDDGKKRSMFIMINFLSSVGYSFDSIEEIMSKWNQKNKEPLREVILTGQIRYRKAQHKATGKKVLPPNCDNKSYYQDLRICTPDNFCSRIKNPVNYTILKSKIVSGTAAKGKRVKLSEEQKDMRRKFRDTKKKTGEEDES
jgi:hypothetical protein